MNPFREPTRLVLLVGGPIVLGVMAAVFAYTPVALEAVTDAPPVVGVERYVTPEERHEGRCEALRAEQPSPQIAVLAEEQAEREGCAR